MIDATGAAAATPTQQSQSGVSQATLTADYEAFLQLLTAQVANQDPLEPMDSSTFVTQLAQLSQVEQSIMTNAHLEGISSQLLASTALSDAALIGRDVLTSTSKVGLGPSGGADMSYKLAANASSVTATILSEQGVALRSFEGLPTTAGTTHDLHWDGNDFHGLPLPAGSYTVKIEAVNSAGEPIAYETFAQSEVESVLFVGGESMLELANGDVIPATSISAVR